MNSTWQSLSKLFKIDSLRTYQKEVFQKLLHGRDCFVGQPTGSGKSLLFHAWPFLKKLNENTDASVSSFESDDTVIVISPITSLIHNQISILQNIRIKAVSLGLDTDTKVLENTEYNIVFTSPEAILEKHRILLKNKAFIKNVIGIAIDESHCVKKWGEGDNKSEAFRSWYSRLSEIRSFVPSITLVLAVTSTATAEVRKDIINSLELFHPFICVDVPMKWNINYHVESTSTKDPDVLFSYYLKQIEEKAFDAERVFCRNMDNLRKVYGSFDTQFCRRYPDRLNRPYGRYHGNSEDAVQDAVNKSFSTPSGGVRVLVATIAFGMGIDCKGLNTVIHYGPPNDLDDYFQQSGRIGRDGSQSNAILLLFPNCLKSKYISKAMKEYCKSDSCRRKLLMEQCEFQFTPMAPLHNCCDICQNNCICDDNDCSKKHTLTYFEKTFSTDTLDQSSLNKDGREYLQGKLVYLRESILNEQGVVSPSISSGFPIESIDQIVNIASPSLTVKNIYLKTSLMDKDILKSIHKIIMKVVTEPLFEKKDFDEEESSEEESSEEESDQETLFVKYRCHEESTESD